MATENPLLRVLPELTHAGEDWYQVTHLMTVNGTTWQVAMDHGWAFAVKVNAKPVRLQGKHPRMERLKFILENKPQGHVYRAAVRDLASWAGPCPSSYDFDTAEIDNGRLFGLTLDRRRLAYLMARIPFEEISLWDASVGVGMDCIGMSYKKDWLCFLAGTRLAEDMSVEDLPLFNVEDPYGEASAFEAAMSLPQE